MIPLLLNCIIVYYVVGICYFLDLTFGKVKLSLDMFCFNLFFDYFQTLLEAGFISVYNLFYTSQPVLALACFDQDVKPIYATKVHHYYLSTYYF